MVILSKARDGSSICSTNGVQLHSAYNPIKEAQRFVSALVPPFEPAFVVITEPALSYTAQFLRQRFPQARLFAVRYCDDFNATDALWDGVFHAMSVPHSCEDNGATLKTSLYNALGEEGLFSTFFCAWQPSSRAFEKENDSAWHEIQDAVHLSRDVLATRTKFASRWVLNAFSLCARVNSGAVIQKGDAPIVVAASGASLASSLPYLEKRRGEYFLIALSSALSPLCHAGVQCDLCLTTDGGFYAGSHLSPYNRGVAAPLAVAAEGHCPGNVLEKAVVIPLVYDDGPSSQVVRRCVPPAVMTAERNGTVSGTALKLALRLTTGNVYFCGLDLSSGNGLQHCPPNVLENMAEAQDNRLCNMEVRMARSRFSSSSLEIYRKWFEAIDADTARRVFRLSCGTDASDVYHYNNTLGHIRDVSFNRFYQYLDEHAKCNAKHANGADYLPRFSPCALPSREERIRVAKDLVQKNGATDDWLREVFPADCISILHAMDEKEKAKRKATLKAKNKALLDKIYRILHNEGNS